MVKSAHKYIGIFLAYIGFFILFSGTLGYYKDEITFFMQEENYKLDYNSPNALKSGIDYLSKHHANADVWEITLPSQLMPYVLLSYKNDKNAHQHRSQKPRIYVDPQTGEKVRARSTYGGNFISKLHFNLWYIKPMNAREIMGYITLFMIFVIVSGVVIHKRIFKDFFKFRTNILWRDGHILTAISSLTIIFMLCVSGLYLVERFMLKEIYEDLQAKNQATMQQEFFEKAKAKREAKKREKAQSAVANLTKNLDQNSSKFSPNSLKILAKTPYIPNVDEIKNIINKGLEGKELKSISIQKDSPKTAYIQLNLQSNRPFSDEGVAFEARLYDAKTGELKDSMSERKVNSVQKTAQFMKIFHMALFGGGGVKFGFFVFGILGLTMCLSGALLWQKNSKSKAVFYTARFLNAFVFIGIFSAFGAYLLSNKLISLSTPLRHNLEVNWFFIALSISALISAIFIKKYSHTILSFLTAILFLLTAILGLVAGSYANLISLGVNIFIVVLAAVFGYLGSKFLKDKK